MLPDGRVVYADEDGNEIPEEEALEDGWADDEGDDEESITSAGEIKRRTSTIN